MALAESAPKSSELVLPAAGAEEGRREASALALPPHLAAEAQLLGSLRRKEGSYRGPDGVRLELKVRVGDADGLF